MRNTPRNPPDNASRIEKTEKELVRTEEHLRIKPRQLSVLLYFNTVVKTVVAVILLDLKSLVTTIPKYYMA